MTDSSELLLERHVFGCELADQPVQVLVLRGKLGVARLDLGGLHLFALAAELGALPVALHARLLSGSMTQLVQPQFSMSTYRFLQVLLLKRRVAAMGAGAAIPSGTAGGRCGAVGSCAVRACCWGWQHGWVREEGDAWVVKVAGRLEQGLVDGAVQQAVEKLEDYVVGCSRQVQALLQCTVLSCGKCAGAWLHLPGGHGAPPSSWLDCDAGF